MSEISMQPGPRQNVRPMFRKADRRLEPVKVRIVEACVAAGAPREPGDLVELPRPDALYLIGWGRAVAATAPPTDRERARKAAPIPGALIARRSFCLPGTFMVYNRGDVIDVKFTDGEAAHLLAQQLAERAPAPGKRK